MDVVQPTFGLGFYALTLVISGVLFFWWRRLFRRVLKSETVAVIATGMAAIITTPLVFVAVLWLWHALGNR